MTDDGLREEVLLVGYGPLADFLTSRGYPISKSQLSKLGAPSIAQGPASEGFWGKRPAFRPSVALAWARARMRPLPGRIDMPGTAPTLDVDAAAAPASVATSVPAE
jgi:hypothetical protein